MAMLILGRPAHVNGRRSMGQGAAGYPLPRLRPRPAVKARQRLENWKLRRAFMRPYFLRSTTRLSRDKNPPFYNTGLSSGSK